MAARAAAKRFAFMNLYLDDDSASLRLATMLRGAGHSVAIPADFGMIGASDARHLICAVERNLILLTRNYKDFLDLHDLVRGAQGEHPGVLVVRLDNDPSRDMKDRDVVRAIANLEHAGVPIVNELHVLNHWR
jgi:predicted nuclease of predicted toxin-antitoxin system